MVHVSYRLTPEHSIDRSLLDFIFVEFSKSLHDLIWKSNRSGELFESQPITHDLIQHPTSPLDRSGMILSGVRPWQTFCSSLPGRGFLAAVASLNRTEFEGSKIFPARKLRDEYILALCKTSDILGGKSSETPK